MQEVCILDVLPLRPFGARDSSHSTHRDVLHPNSVRQDTLDPVDRRDGPDKTCYTSNPDSVDVPPRQESPDRPRRTGLFGTITLSAVTTLSHLSYQLGYPLTPDCRGSTLPLPSGMSTW